MLNRLYWCRQRGSNRLESTLAAVRPALPASAGTPPRARGHQILDGAAAGDQLDGWRPIFATPAGQSADLVVADQRMRIISLFWDPIVRSAVVLVELPAWPGTKATSP